MRHLPSVDVVVDTAALVRTESGVITGPIWLRDGDPDVQADFPEVGWVDVPVATLAAWVQELQRLTRTVPAVGIETACRFIEGPYYFAVHVESAGGWLVRCFEVREPSTGGDHPVHEWKTGSSAFLASAVRAGRAVLAQCDTRGWWNAETEALRRCLESGSQYRIG